MGGPRSLVSNLHHDDRAIAPQGDAKKGTNVISFGRDGSDRIYMHILFQIMARITFDLRRLHYLQPGKK